MPAPIPMELPPPLADAWDWQLRARCRTDDAALFFHPDNERGRERTARARAAKQICDLCPVRDQCRSYAEKAGERYGTWGGLSEDDRKAYRRRSQWAMENGVRPRVAG
ncbi:WhiB family transcriptional regulator [Rhodococcus sp. T2V]|uniref:WhiB family transcriptional regulator n=1 Tax=Rhodococcus sp. T2V TaxID=3034164 RepID=UPI0031FE8CA9